MSNNPYQTPFNQFSEKPAPQATPSPSHSGLGIASFAVSFLSGGVLMVMIGVATYFAATMEGEMSEESPQAILLGLAIIAGMGLAVIGAGLGIAGIAQPNRNKIFAILGVIFNALVVLAVCGLMGLGMAMG